MTKNYVLRGKWYHYMRRVPKHLEAYDSRMHIRIALKTKNETEAAKLAGIYNDFIEKYWRNLVKTGRQDGRLRDFQKAKAIAMAHGFAYKDISEIAEAPLEEILSRIEAVENNPGAKKSALLGAARMPRLKLGECPEKFWPLCSDRLAGRSESQVRKFKNPRVAALNDFIGVVGNLDAATVDRSHVIRFRAWLMDRIAKTEITGNTANKKLGHVKDILTTVALHAELDTDFKQLFSETWLSQETQSRPPFEASYVQNTLLDGKCLEGLNFDARMLVYMMVETGARESEIIGLDPEDIMADEEIPHIWIRKNRNRTLKTRTSERKVPLVGVSHIAARQIAETGISRYQKNPYNASGLINKYLREHDLKPTPKHTLYSLRHTFKDRLRDAQAPEEVIDELMGHKKRGPKYGRGHMLETKHEWLQKIAFDPYRTERSIKPIS